jgi:hypothetical protein
VAGLDGLRTIQLPDVLVTSSRMPVIFILMFTYVFGAVQAASPTMSSTASSRCR